jgi:hypothetical protein
MAFLKIEFLSDQGFKELQDSLRTDSKSLRKQVKDLGSQTAEQMKTIIKDSKVRPQAGEPTTLEANIDVEFFADDRGWGVGDIEKLNKNAEYWRAVNFGSNHLVGKRLPLGRFEPDPENGRPNDAYFREGRWKVPGVFSALVKRPIPAMNYIEKTVNFLRRKINEIRFGG